MPKRTGNYRSRLFERLMNPLVAANYLNEAIADSLDAFLKALRNVAEAHRMAKVAEDAGVTREALYKTLSVDGNPRLDTLRGILEAVGLHIAVEINQSISAPSSANLPQPTATQQQEDKKFLMDDPFVKLSPIQRGIASYQFQDKELMN